MGNGPRLTIDIETAPLSMGDIEDAAARAIANFGRPNLIFMGGGLLMPFEANPEFTGTPWADMYKLTKRERAVAGLHTTLKKLGVLKKISEDELNDIKNTSVKRLKKAKWAKYQQKKVQSPR